MQGLVELLRKKSQLLKMVTGALLLLVVALLVLRPQTVKVVYPSLQDLTAELYGNGTVEAKVVVPVASKVTARIVSVYADQGDLVKKGQLLARLDRREIEEQESQGLAQGERARAAMELEQAQVRKAELSRDQAVLNAKRYRALAAKDLVAAMEAEQYETAAKTAEAEVVRARAALAAARKEQQVQGAALGTTRSRLADLTIVAPSDGIIISRNQEVGATVTPGMALFRLADPSTIWVRAAVDESGLQGLAIGQTARISVRSAPGEEFGGHVARIGHESDRVTEESTVEVAFDTPRRAQRIGEQAEVRIQTMKHAGVLSVPAAAVVFNGRESGVWTADNGKMRFRTLKTGIKDSRGLVEVISGLKKGEAVVSESPEKMARFRDGKRIRVQP